MLGLYETILSDFKSLDMALFRQTLRLTTMTRSVPVALYHEKVGLTGVNASIISIDCRLLTTMRIPAMWARWIPRKSMWAQGLWGLPLVEMS